MTCGYKIDVMNCDPREWGINQFSVKGHENKAWGWHLNNIRPEFEPILLILEAEKTRPNLSVIIIKYTAVVLDTILQDDRQS